MAALLSQGLAAAQHLNPHVSREGDLFYITLSDGKTKQISSSMEGHKVAVGCTCTGGHVKYCTPNSIRAERDLLCQFCHHSQLAWKLAKRRQVVESEKEAMKALTDVGLDKRVACEVALPFWHGRVDFYDIPSRTVMQADGRSHYVKTHNKQPGQQLKLDLRCCPEAWKHGVRLLRLYHSPTADNSRWGQAMLAATKLQAAKFVMLSSEYADLVVDAAQQRTCIDWLTARLAGAEVKYHATVQCHLWLTL